MQSHRWPQICHPTPEFKILRDVSDGTPITGHRPSKRWAADLSEECKRSYVSDLRTTHRSEIFRDRSIPTPAKHHCDNEHQTSNRTTHSYINHIQSYTSERYLPAAVGLYLSLLSSGTTLTPSGLSNIACLGGSRAICSCIGLYHFRPPLGQALGSGVRPRNASASRLWHRVGHVM
jgi:hypothetical protein